MFFQTQWKINKTQEWERKNNIYLWYYVFSGYETLFHLCFWQSKDNYNKPKWEELIDFATEMGLKTGTKTIERYSD